MVTEPLPAAADPEHLTSAIRHPGALVDGRVRTVEVAGDAAVHARRAATRDRRSAPAFPKRRCF
jgi:hypothetical protein